MESVKTSGWRPREGFYWQGASKEIQTRAAVPLQRECLNALVKSMQTTGYCKYEHCLEKYRTRHDNVRICKHIAHKCRKKTTLALGLYYRDRPSTRLPTSKAILGISSLRCTNTIAIPPHPRIIRHLCLSKSWIKISTEQFTDSEYFSKTIKHPLGCSGICKVCCSAGGTVFAAFSCKNRSRLHYARSMRHVTQY